jgi:hypothetical protein
MKLRILHIILFCCTTAFLLSGTQKHVFFAKQCSLQNGKINTPDKANNFQKADHSMPDEPVLSEDDDTGDDDSNSANCKIKFIETSGHSHVTPVEIKTACFFSSLLTFQDIHAGNNPIYILLHSLLIPFSC